MKPSTKRLMVELSALLNPDPEDLGQKVALAQLSAAAVLLTLDPARLAHCAEQAANALAVLDGGGVRMVIARLEPRHTFAGPPDELQRRTAAFASLLAHPLVVAQMARTAAPGVSPVKVPSWVHTAVPAFAVAGSGC